MNFQTALAIVQDDPDFNSFVRNMDELARIAGDKYITTDDREILRQTSWAALAAAYVQGVAHREAS
jgi:hypothetical protein